MSRVTLAQWQMLAAVVDHGGFARAAEAIHKSPSTLNHAVHKLEEQLGVEVLEPVGRQVRLTEAGELLLRRARQLLEAPRPWKMSPSGSAKGWRPRSCSASIRSFLPMSWRAHGGLLS